jgi:hypothetical protein
LRDFCRKFGTNLLGQNDAAILAVTTAPPLAPLAGNTKRQVIDQLERLNGK